MLSDVLGVKLALGSVCNIENRLSEALRGPVEEAKQFIQEQPVVHADETSWLQDKKKAWLWAVACPLVAVFLVAASRGKAIAQSLLGCCYNGIAVTDRWSGYAWLPLSNRQVCWAHLVRDFQSWVDGGGVGEKIGRAILKSSRQMFGWWHQVRIGAMPRDVFSKKMRAVQLRVATALNEAEACGDSRIEGMAAKILQVESALWTFVDEEGVEPTNNYGEGIIRGAVIWRKLCFGTDSESGSRFVERIMTTVTSLKLQRRNVLEYLTEVYRCALAKKEPPSLLPVNTFPATVRKAA
jgi:transposase